MKKLLVLAGLSAVLAMSIQAADYRTDVFAGVSGTKIDGVDTKADVSLGFGVSKVYSNKVYAGVDFDVSYFGLDGVSVYGIGGDLKLGYNVWDKLNVYGIGGYKIHSFEGDAAYGFGYGIGMEYPVYKNVIASVDYKTYKMDSSNVGDYDYQTAGVKLRYTF